MPLTTDDEPRDPRICFHPGDAWLAGTPAEDEPRDPRICFHPGDAWRGSLTEADERALAVLAKV
jgi:hypothetical protein